MKISDEDFIRIITEVAKQNLGQVRYACDCIEEALNSGVPNPTILAAGLHQARETLWDAYNKSFKPIKKEGDIK